VINKLAKQVSNRCTLISVALRHKDNDHSLKLLHSCLTHDAEVRRPACDS